MKVFTNLMFIPGSQRKAVGDLTLTYVDVITDHLSIIVTETLYRH